MASLDHLIPGTLANFSETAQRQLHFLLKYLTRFLQFVKQLDTAAEQVKLVVVDLILEVASFKVWTAKQIGYDVSAGGPLSRLDKGPPAETSYPICFVRVLGRPLGTYW